MNYFNTKILPFIKRYKWPLLLIAPLFLLMLLLVLFNDVTEEPDTQIAPTPTISQTTNGTTGSQDPEDDVYELALEDNPEERFNFQRKETDGEGVTTYFYTSNNPERPNLLQTKPGNIPIFARKINETEISLGSTNIYEEAYGQPERIIKGSRYYGQNYETRIYGSLGLAIIADPQTRYVAEEHLFTPMSVDDYISRFGQDIINN